MGRGCAWEGALPCDFHPEVCLRKVGTMLRIEGIVVQVCVRKSLAVWTALGRKRAKWCLSLVVGEGARSGAGRLRKQPQRTYEDTKGCAHG